MIAGFIERAGCDGVYCRGFLSTQERQNEQTQIRRGWGMGCTKASVNRDKAVRCRVEGVGRDDCERMCL